jgi:hypothetical protein
MSHWPEHVKSHTYYGRMLFDCFLHLLLWIIKRRLLKCRGSSSRILLRWDRWLCRVTKCTHRSQHHLFVELLLTCWSIFHRTNNHASKQ